MWPRPKCTECGKEFYPHRERIFDKESQTCGSPECQRKRKTRLQRERRDRLRTKENFDHIEWLRQSRSSLPQIAGKVKQRPAGVPPKQRKRISADIASKQRGSAMPQGVRR